VDGTGSVGAATACSEALRSASTST
jgi:hypothetical protein